MRAAYGIRFKNTKQCAAYKWETKYTDTDPVKYYISVKIKALPENTNITVYDITDNNSYWQSGYIEYKFPLLGDLIYKTGIIDNTTNSYYITSSYRTDGNEIYVASYIDMWGLNKYGEWSNNSKRSLRLVKVKEPAEGTESAE